MKYVGTLSKLICKPKGKNDGYTSIFTVLSCYIHLELSSNGIVNKEVIRTGEGGR